MRTDYIDLYQIHWLNPDIPIGETFTAYEKEIPNGLMDEIEAASESLKAVMGDHADLWVGNGGRFY